VQLLCAFTPALSLPSIRPRSRRPPPSHPRPHPRPHPQRQGSYAEEGRSVNHMKAGIATADRLVTVSPGEWTAGGWRRGGDKLGWRVGVTMRVGQFQCGGCKLYSNPLLTDY